MPDPREPNEQQLAAWWDAFVQGTPRQHDPPDDPDTARLMGINVDRIIVIAED